MVSVKGFEGRQHICIKVFVKLDLLNHYVAECVDDKIAEGLVADGHLSRDLDGIISQ